MKSKSSGLSLVEVMIVLAIMAILILAAMTTLRAQIIKGRDAKRKADLNKLQKVLEDYYNDEGCYPSAWEPALSPYLRQIPQDPVNIGEHIYYYSFSQDEPGECKSWFKILTSLENKNDSDIEKVGCAGNACQPFNYVVSSTNVVGSEGQPGEDWPPVVPGVPTPTPAVPPIPTPTLPAFPTATPTPGALPTATPTPGALPTATPTICPGWFSCVAQEGKCNAVSEGYPGAVCSSTCNNCTAAQCSLDCL